MSASGDEDPIVEAVRRCLDAGGPLDLLTYASGVIDASRSGLTDLDERTVLATLVGGDGERQVLAYAIRILLRSADARDGLQLPDAPSWLASLGRLEPVRAGELVDEDDDSGVIAIEFAVVDRTVTVALIVDRAEVAVHDAAVMALPLDEAIEHFHRDFSGQLTDDRLELDVAAARARAALVRYQRGPDANDSPTWPRLQPLVAFALGRLP